MGHVVKVLEAGRTAIVPLLFSDVWLEALRIFHW